MNQMLPPRFPLRVVRCPPRGPCLPWGGPAAGNRNPRFWLAPGVIEGPPARAGLLRRVLRALRRMWGGV